MRALASLEYREAIGRFAEGFETAKQSGKLWRAQRFLSAQAGAYLALHEYRDAMEVYERAGVVARQCGNREAEALVDLNLATLFSLLGDADAATQEMQEAQQLLPVNSRHWTYFYASQSQLALRMRDRSLLVEAAEKGMDAADAQGDAEVRAALAVDLGLMWLESGNVDRAEAALLEAYRLRKLHHLRDVERVLLGLSQVAKQRGQAERAVWLAEVAGKSRAYSPSFASPWQSEFALGQGLAAAGRGQEALDAYRKALRIAAEWRQEIVPAAEIEYFSGIGLAQVAGAYGSLAAELGAREGDQELMWEAFLAVEQTRAAALGGQRQRRLAADAEYREALAQWRSQQFWIFTSDRQRRKPGEATALALQRRLRTLESRAGAADGDVPRVEGKGGRRRLQAALGRNDALLSFSAGEGRSWLWALTRDSFEQVPLTGRDRMMGLLAGFREAVRRGLPGTEAQGEELYRELFGGLSANVLSKQRWLLSMDDGLLEAPLAALSREEGGTRRYLVQDHELEPVASALLVMGGKTRVRPAELFLGVGDPIYNRADARWTPGGNPSQTGVSLELPRLPGSATELERIGRQWGSAGAEARLLTGGEATPERFAAELEMRPKAIHLAAHLIQEESDARGFLLLPWAAEDRPEAMVRRPAEMFLMLSLRPDGRADGLTARSVGAFTLPGSLVVMSGCGTGLGTHQPGAGPAGFFKSWIGAGACAAIGTLWSIPDDASALFDVFYTCFRRGAEPSAALREAQLALLAKGGWQSRPAFWGAWTIVGRN